MKAKAAPKAKVRAGRGRGRAIPLAGVLKRPGVRVRAPGKAKKEAEKEGVYKSSEATLELCRSFSEIEVVEGTYWDGPVTAVVKVLEVKILRGEVYLEGQILGTQSEPLLRAATGLPDRKVRLHLCGDMCAGNPHEEDLIHMTKFRQAPHPKEDWMSNLVGVGAAPREEDELPGLRRDMEKRREAAQSRGKGVGDGNGEEALESEEEAAKAKKAKKKKRKLKIDHTKPVEGLFKNTGLDADPEVRERFRKRASKLARKKSKDKDPSKTSSSSSEGSGGALADRDIFGGSGKVRVIGQKMPGALCAAAIEEASEGQGGLYSLHSGALPPLMQRYHRQMLAPRMSPAMSRESQTLAVIIDTALRGQLSQSLDVAAQRLKSVEMMSQGVHFSVAQQQELLVKEQSSLSSVPEFREAAVRAREENKAKAEAQRPYGYRTPGGRYEEGQKGGKNQNQKGGGKNKQGKNDGKKNDKDNQDGQKPRGG